MDQFPESTEDRSDCLNRRSFFWKVQHTSGKDLSLWKIILRFFSIQGVSGQLHFLVRSVASINFQT